MIIYCVIGMVCFLAGFIIGVVRSKKIGRFIIDDEDFEKTRWTISLDVEPEEIKKHKQIRLEVRNAFASETWFIMK